MESKKTTLLIIALVMPLVFLAGCTEERSTPTDPLVTELGRSSLTPSQMEGRDIFRFDDFGSHVFWTETARLNELIETAVTPNFALGTLGLKVDGEVITPEVLASLPEGALDDPATTVRLLELDAVIGLKATVDDGALVNVGLTCALCHTQVDDSVAPGIGRRLDGWPNRDLDVGLILASLPGLPAIAEEIGVSAAALEADFLDWGPGYYDARVNVDGRVDDPEPVIPPAYGLRGIGLETFTGEGPVSYWNNYVAVTQMHGIGSFIDPQLGLEIRVPPQEDQVRHKLPALRRYQFTLTSPAPPMGSFDPEAAERGRAVFEGDGRCASCHAGPQYTDHGVLHAPEETGMEPTWAERGTTGGYRTTPLRALWQHAPYFHDGSAATLVDVVEHYDSHLQLDLSEAQKEDLVEFLRSL